MSKSNAEGASATRVPFTPGPWEQAPWGNVAFEIQGGGHAIAIVGRVQAKRLDYLNGVRSKAAKNGEQAYQAEHEATRIEQTDLLPDARLISAAPDLYDVLRAIHGRILYRDHPISHSEFDALWARIDAALAKAEGRSAAQPPSDSPLPPSALPPKV